MESDQMTTLKSLCMLPALVLFTSLLFVILPSNVSAAEKTVEIQKEFSEDILYINVGDTVKWTQKGKHHNVEMKAGPMGYALPQKSKLGDEVKLTFQIPGVYLYVCTPHISKGMVALIIVGKDTQNKGDVAKTKLQGQGSSKLKSLIGAI